MYTTVSMMVSIWILWQTTREALLVSVTFVRPKKDTGKKVCLNLQNTPEYGWMDGWRRSKDLENSIKVCCVLQKTQRVCILHTVLPGCDQKKALCPYESSH